MVTADLTEENYQRLEALSIFYFFLHKKEWKQEGLDFCFVQFIKINDGASIKIATLFKVRWWNFLFLVKSLKCLNDIFLVVSLAPLCAVSWRLLSSVSCHRPSLQTLWWLRAQKQNFCKMSWKTVHKLRMSCQSQVDSNTLSVKPMVA